MKTYFTSIAIAVLFSCAASAQYSRLYGTGEQGADKLSCNLINDICQDTRGFIWIATEYGLNHFDGMKFTHYLHNEKDSTSLLANNVRKLMPDNNDHTLWIAYFNGLQNYNPLKNKFQTICFSDNAAPHVTDLIRLASGELLIATANNGLYKIKKDRRVAYPLEEVNRLLETLSVQCIYEDSARNLWIALSGAGLLCMNPDTKTHQAFRSPDLPSNDIIFMVENNNGSLYAGNSTIVLFFDRAANRFLTVPYTDTAGKGLSIRCMAASRKGTIFIGTDGQGLKYIDTKEKRIYSVQNNQTLFDFDNARIHALMEDRDRSLWLGCFSKGILMLPNESAQFGFWSPPHREYKLGGSVISICKDHQGFVWCGIDTEGMYRFDSKGKMVQHIPQPRSVMKIAEDSNHTLWIGSWQGLGKLNKETGKSQFLPFKFDGYIKVITEDKNKRLYLSVFGHGFMRYDLSTGKLESFEDQPGENGRGVLPNHGINAIICDSKGLVWLGHYAGVTCYDPEQDRFINGKFNPILSSQICLSLLEDHSGNIWMGTYNGLFRIDVRTGDVKNYTMDDGLSNNVICGLAEDETGAIWCSTFLGINQLKVKEGTIVNYLGNGLIDKIYNRGIYFQDKEGTVYFGGNSGLTVFSPQNIKAGHYEREILITNFYVHNQLVNLGNTKKRQLSYEDNTFTVEFSTMDFQDPENIYYEYRLKGLDSKWNATLPGTNRIAYNYLPSGNYTLEVRACKYGSYTPVQQWFLQILPPWYKSSWAYACYALLLTTIALLIFSLIKKRREEILIESKLRFFINISHEIRSPMTLIISPLEKLLKGNHDAGTLKTLEGMQRNARRIFGLINQLLDIRKIDKGQMKLKFSETDLVGFIEELFDVFEYQVTQRNIRFTFEHHAEKLLVWIDRNNFDKVLMNVLSNAFKYTSDDGEIAIFLTSGIDAGNWGALHDYAEIRIIDTGTGIDEDKIGKIFDRFYQAHNELTFGAMGSGIGLNLSHTLVELHQGTITASNRKDVKGSCFTIRLPLGKDHIKKENLAKNEPNSRLIWQQGLPVRPSKTKKKSVKRKTDYKLLIVDDEEEIRDFMRLELEESYKIMTAANGNEAWQITLSQLPDLIISDIMMPEMDGFTFVKKLKVNSNVSHIPVILLSSKAEHEDRLQGLGKGADAYLSKPFNIDELLVMIENLISSRRMLKGKFSGAQDQQDKVKSVDFKSSDELLMERIMTILNNHIANPDLNVEMLASQAGLSRVQLHRKLKEMTGIPASDFIRNIRLKQAAKLLNDKKMNITQVAYAVGFANQTHFSTAFKKFFGISPTEYIAQIE